MMTREAKSITKPNLYLLLDISPGASHNDILHAYARAKITYGSGSLAAYSVIDEDEKAKILDDIERAFEILGNPSKRREYDMAMGFEEAPSGAVDPVVDPHAVIGGETVVVREKKGGSSILEQLKARAAESAAASSPPASVEESAPRHARSNVTPLRKPAVATEPKMPHYEANPEFEEKIRSCEAIDGAFLRAVRIYRRMSVEELALLCKLSPSHVTALEEEDPSGFRQPVYLRGHVLLVCRSLDLPEPDRLARSYVDRMKSQGKIVKSPF